MPISLHVHLYCNDAVAVPLAKRFERAGGTLGRAPGNDLVLEDAGKYISRIHAKISFEHGAYRLTDVGSNPTLVNGRPLGAGRAVALADGDVLELGDYQLRVLVEDEPEAWPPSPLQVDAPPPAPVLPTRLDTLADAKILTVGAASVLPEQAVASHAFAIPALPASGSPAPLAFRGAESDHVSPEFQAFQFAPAMAIPEGYDPLADHFSPPPVDAGVAPSPRPTAPPLAEPLPPPPAAPPLAELAPSGGDDGDAVVRALLRGLGLSALPGTRPAAELAELAGAMLRAATAGTMSLLAARAVSKRESRLDMTLMASHANNPLKFLPDVDSALRQMLTNGMAGYMAPLPAYENAVEDLAAHELATMAGMRAALAATLRRFEPSAIEARLHVPSVLDKVLATRRKAKMWDRLAQLYQDISHDADDDFQRVFGEQFSAAYDEQIARMRRVRA